MSPRHICPHREARLLFWSGPFCFWKVLASHWQLFLLPQWKQINEAEAKICR